MEYIFAIMAFLAVTSTMIIICYCAITIAEFLHWRQTGNRFADYIREVRS